MGLGSARHASAPPRRVYLCKRSSNSGFPARIHGAMLAAMTDTETLESLRNAIRTLFPAGPTRCRWIARADRIQAEESRSTGWTHKANRRQNSLHAARSFTNRT